MKNNIKVVYSTNNGSPTLKRSAEIDNALISRDASIIRFFKDSSNGHIFSPIIFLSEKSYNAWNDRYVEELDKKSSSLAVVRSRFLNGLDVLDEYFAHQVLSIEDKSEVAKIRNHVVNINPESLKTVEAVEIKYLEDAVDRLKTIIGSDITDDTFYTITQGYFMPEEITDKVKGYHLRQFPELQAIDNEIGSLNDYFSEPESDITESRFFNSSSEYKEFLKDIEDYEIDLSAYVSKKIEIIKELLSKGEFDDELSEINEYKFKKSPTKEIIDIVNDRYRVCSVCGSKTDSSFCSNIECTTVTMPAYSYQISSDNVFDYFLNKATKINIESKSLITTNNKEKAMAITVSGRSFVSDLNDFLDNNPSSVRINHINLNKKQNAKNDLDGDLCKDGSKVAIFDDHDDEIKGRVVHFWDYFENKGNIYGIIQTAREIKTPSLVSEVREYRNKIGSARPIDPTPDYYDNPVYFVVADAFGQIKEVGEGILYTSDEDNYRLKLGMGSYDHIVSIKRPKYRPVIDDIFFYCDDTNLVSEVKDLDVERIFDELNHSNEKALTAISDIYRYSRRYFYPPELGYFVYEKNGFIHKFSESEVEDLGTGSINKYEFITLHDAIRYKEYNGFNPGSWLAKLAKVYFGNLFSPNVGSVEFLKDYDKSSDKRFRKTLSEATKDASLLPTLITNSKSVPVYIRRDAIVTNSNIEKKLYSARHLTVSNIREVTPFFFREMKNNDLIEKIEFTINNNQSEVRNGKLNILRPSMGQLLSPRVSTYLPRYMADDINALNSKQLIQKGLSIASSVDDFTVSLNITLNKEITLYEMTLLEKYLSENGLTTMKREESSMPIPVRTNDLISFIL